MKKTNEDKIWLTIKIIFPYDAQKNGLYTFSLIYSEKKTQVFHEKIKYFDLTNYDFELNVKCSE